MKKNLYWAAALPLAAGLHSPAFALSDAEILQRLEAYESRIKALEAQLTKSDKTSQQAKSRVQSLSNQVRADKERIRFSGFLSAGATVSNVNNANYLGTIEGGKVNFQKDSIVGVQTDYKISDKSKAVVQLVGRGEDDDWDITAEWAFVDYALTDTLAIRSGRMRNPRYMVSEYLEVGYSYLWVRPPEEVYNLVGTNSFDGFMALYNPSVDDIDFNFQVYWGRNVNNGDDSEGEVDITLNNTMGITALANWRDWTFRLGYSRADLDANVSQLLFIDDENVMDIQTEPDIITTLDRLIRRTGDGDQFEVDNTDTEFMSVGFQYDNGDLVAIGEAIRARNPGILADTESHYLTLGYRIGEFTPYATYAKLRTFDNDLRANLTDPLASGIARAAFNQAQTRYALGLRYDFAPGLAAKFEVSGIHELEGTSGFFSSEGPVENDGGEIFTFVLDSVF